MTEDDAILIAAARCAARDGTAQWLRERNHLARSEIALVIEVTPQTIGRWEDGDITPRGAAALRYGRLLVRLGLDLRQPVTA